MCLPPWNRPHSSTIAIQPPNRQFVKDFCQQSRDISFCEIIPGRIRVNRAYLITRNGKHGVNMSYSISIRLTNANSVCMVISGSIWLDVSRFWANPGDFYRAARASKTCLRHSICSNATEKYRFHGGLTSPSMCKRVPRFVQQSLDMSTEIHTSRFFLTQKCRRSNELEFQKHAYATENVLMQQKNIGFMVVWRLLLCANSFPVSADRICLTIANLGVELSRDHLSSHHPTYETLVTGRI